MFWISFGWQISEMGPGKKGAGTAPVQWKRVLYTRCAVFAHWKLKKRQNIIEMEREYWISGIYLVWALSMDEARLTGWSSGMAEQIPASGNYPFIFPVKLRKVNWQQIIPEDMCFVSDKTIACTQYVGNGQLDQLTSFHHTNYISNMCFTLDSYIQ